jgi:DinB family protein
MSRLAELSALVLEPLRDRTDAEWERGPAGKWTPAQIVEHLALGLTLSAETFQARRDHAPMSRRSRTPAEQIATLLILGFRWFPPGRKAPSRTKPMEQITRPVAEAHFRAGIAGWEQVERDLLPTRGQDLFVKHPRLGDLTIGEWIRFHLIHGRHHARQIRRRIGA